MLYGCQEPYYYLSESDFDGYVMESNNNVYKMNLKVNAKSKCPSKIEVNLNSYNYVFTFISKLDTMLSRDWYGDPMTVVVKHDSCVVGIPKIGIRLID